MKSVRAMWWGVLVGSVMALGACGDDVGGASHDCSAALGKVTDCDVSDTAIQQVGLCISTDGNDGCAAACLNSASCTDVTAYYKGQQMNSLGDCLSNCNQ